MAAHSSTCAWKTPRTEEPGGLRSRGSRSAGQDRAAEHTVACKALPWLTEAVCSTGPQRSGLCLPVASANRGLLISCRGSLGSGPGLRANSPKPPESRCLPTFILSPPAPSAIMRGFIFRVCFSRGRMAGPLLASGVCSEQEEGEA